MNFDQIKQLMDELQSSKLKKLVVKKGDFELQLEKEGETTTLVAAMPPRQAIAEAAIETAFLTETSQRGERGGSQKQEESGAFVKSPMVGTFYSSPSPDQPHFVKVGDRVTEGTVVCIIEAMKVMNEVKAGVSGTVAEILADNSQPVEFGSKLFRVT